MTIRFTCAGCGSLLKIKDELAGTDGKCPKCKTEFVVPDPESDDDDEDAAELLVAPSEPARTPAKPAVKAAERIAIGATVEPASKPVVTKPVTKPAAKQDKNAAGDDFDPTDFLMGDDNSPRPSAPAFEDLPDADPPAVESRQKRPAGKAPVSGGGAAVEAVSGGGASAYAKEMMMKAMDESRAHASEMPRQAERAGFDFAGFFREFGLKIGGGMVFGVVLSYGLYLMFDSMMSTRLTLPPFGYVEGTVKLDGRPLPGATVHFAPLDATIPGGKKERARTSYGITDDKGHYRMIYINQTQGVAAGRCRVWLDLIGLKGQVIPADFTEGTMQVREVKLGSQPPFDFDMKSR